MRMSNVYPTNDPPTAPAFEDKNRIPAVSYHQTLLGQPALVTGANSGIGRAIALGLARAGADVAINYVTDPAAADDGAHEITAMFADAVKAFGTLHISVSNAGLQRDAPFEQMTLEQWNTVIGVNLTGQFLCTREAVREFNRRGLDTSVSA